MKQLLNIRKHLYEQAQPNSTPAFSLTTARISGNMKGPKSSQIRCSTQDLPPVFFLRFDQYQATISMVTFTSSTQSCTSPPSAPRKFAWPKISLTRWAKAGRRRGWPWTPYLIFERNERYGIFFERNRMKHVTHIKKNYIKK